ncbi:cyclic nucleotide-binding domain-containing protein [Psychrilyobacter sp.]|uniref:cyclic nucleotide-binding domain-containing protein n=1 Tax=Psychrilyobacter sp. TaxID=2586924 RepID=UPI0030186784
MNTKKSKSEITFKEKQLIFSMLNKISLFGGLTAGEIDYLIPMLTTASFKKGEVVFTQGESPNNIFIIQTGEVKIVKQHDDVEIELIRFQEGNLFGETELIGIFKYIASAITLTDVKLLVFSKSALYSLHSKNMKLFSKIILNVARESCRRTAKTDEYWLEEMVKLRKNHKK